MVIIIVCMKICMKKLLLIFQATTKNAHIWPERHLTALWGTKRDLLSFALEAFQHIKRIVDVKLGMFG